MRCGVGWSRCRSVFGACGGAAGFVARAALHGLGGAAVDGGSCGGPFVFFQFVFYLVDFGYGGKDVGFHGGALFFAAQDTVDELRLAAELHEGFFGGLLVAFFFGEAFAFAGGDAFEDGIGAELGAVARGVYAFVELEFELDAVLLAPFEELALEVDLLACHVVKVDELADDAVAYEPVAVAVATVEIDGTHEGFKGVATQIIVVGVAGGVLPDERVETRLFCQAVEGVALHEFAACGGEKAFALALVAVEDDVAGDGFEDGVAQKFEAFVVERTSLFAADVLRRFVGEGYAVELDVVGVEAEDFV